MVPSSKSTKYNNINGLRALSAIGIALMHYQANLKLSPDMGIITTFIIPWFTHLVLLFFIISSFSVCCGYYDKMKEGKISLNDFYTKRYMRILPFFAILCFIDVVFDFSKLSLAQGFMNCTLTFNLLPVSHFNVIGVGWFLGLIFLFYMLFPFFVFLLDNKARAWGVFIVSLVINFLCQEIFFTPDVSSWNPGRENILYSAPFLIVGGICFLYREKLHDVASKLGNWFLIVCVAINVLYFFVPQSKWTLNTVVPLLVVYSLWLVYAIGKEHKWMQNKVMNFLSKISMEIYLCHMLFFRVVEKLNLDNYINNANVYYMTVCIVGLGMTIIFSFLVKKYIDRILPAIFKCAAR